MDDQAELELRAYLALQGAAGAAGREGDWRRAVAAALRSDAPLSPEFRQALARAIEGDLHGFRLELAAAGGEKKRRQDQFAGVLARRQWMEIGEWMAGCIAAGATRSDAILAAAQQFAASREKCDAALVYFGRAMRWLASIRLAQGDDESVADEGLIDLFHAQDVSGPASGL